MKRNTILYVKDILEYMERAEEHIKNISYEEFLNDSKTMDAVIRCIEVIGEASKNIPEDIRNKYSDIPWRDMSGIRDKIIHSYFKVDQEIVWLVVKEEIPVLKPKIKSLLEDFQGK
ncbi:MAG: HepT-like ribonuclease domain-containing protein [Thermodesulfobacteriota bacterium]